MTPTHAGLAVYAADTGRMLLLQRAVTDGDPAGGLWETPGGSIEEGEAPMAAAAREWAEEVGLDLPEGEWSGSWRSEDGGYWGFAYEVPAEGAVSPTWERHPGDPEGDTSEAIAWWEPDQIAGNPAVRPELLAQLADVAAATGQKEYRAKLAGPARVPAGGGARQVETVKNGYVSLKSVDGQTATVAGYGVVFGGRDLTGDTFTKDTDFMWEHSPAAPVVLFDHGQDESVKKTRIGQVVSMKTDEVGVWVEAQLDLANKYAQAVVELVKKGVLGYSTGSVPHLVERAGHTIKTWPVFEVSLTATPAEPRTAVGTKSAAVAFAVEPQETTDASDQDASARAAAQLQLARALTGTESKAGARNSAADLKDIQAVHDHSVALGATCPTEGATA